MRNPQNRLAGHWGSGIGLSPILILLIVAIQAGVCWAQEQANRKQAAIPGVPAKIHEALDRAAQLYPEPLKGAQWSKSYKLGESDHTIYQLQGTNSRGNKVEIEVTSAGRIIEVEEHGIPLSEVPEIVTKALKAEMPGLSPTLAEAIYQMGHARPVAYGFESEDSGGNRSEVYISSEGKILAK